MIHLWHWFLHWTGSDNTAGVQYGFWSGFGSDLGEIAIIGGLIQVVRHHNCHVKSCPRLGKYHVNGTPYKVCKRHHPALPEDNITYNDVVEAHKQNRKTE